MLHVPPADVRPDAAFEQPRTNLQQIDAEEDKDDTAGVYTELMAELGQKVPFPPTPPPAPAQPCTRWGRKHAFPLFLHRRSGGSTAIFGGESASQRFRCRGEASTTR